MLGLGKLLLGNPYVLIGIAAAFFLLIVGNVTLYALWDGAAKGEKAARLESDLHEADAQRYQAAHETDRAIISGLSGKIETQNAAVASANAAKVKAETFAAAAAREATQAQQDLTALTLRTQERIHAHPEDAHRLGVAACDLYRGMYPATGACTDPAASAAP